MLPQSVQDNIEKSRAAAVAAVAAYNHPGPRFRTEQYIVMIVIAWTALFHAVFYKKGAKAMVQEERNGKVDSLRESRW